MGILINAAAIVSGTFLGAVCKERIVFKNFFILGISIMIISLVGFFENIFNVAEAALQSDELLVVIFSLMLGVFLGDTLHLEEKMSHASSLNQEFSCLIDTAMFFGVGGLQICGPILLVTAGDNSQLLLKSMIDFPFALMFGMSYGKRVALSAVPVAAGQMFIALLTGLSGDFLDDMAIRQLCSMGYIVLFFSGFNLVCEKKYKINNVNMILGILFILLYHIGLRLWRIL